MKYISKHFIEQRIKIDRLEAKEEESEKKIGNIKNIANRAIDKQRELIKREDERLKKEKDRIELERERLKKERIGS